MLNVIRRNAQAAWVKIMFVAIVVVFIFWGMGSVFQDESVAVAARVNDQVIEPTTFSRAYSNMLRVYQDLYKDNFRPELLQALDLKGRVMDQLIRLRLLAQEADRLGLEVTDAELRDTIAKVPAFQQGGRFNKEAYVRTLRANNYTPGAFEDAQRLELLARKLEDLVGAGVHASEAAVRDRFHFDNDKVDLRYLKFDAPDFMQQVTLTDADLQAYYDKQQDRFREPDRVSVELVLYTPEAFSSTVQLGDADVQQYYDTHQSEFATPEQVQARHILIKVEPDATDEVRAQARKRAEDVLQQVKGSADFAALARQFSEDSSAADGGDLGFFERGRMVKPFEDAAFSLTPGTTSDLVESPFGFHIIKVEAKTEPRTKPLDEVRGQVVTALTTDKARAQARAAAEADRTQAAGGAPLAPLAQARGLRVATPSPFARGDAVEPVGSNPDFAQAVFATAKAGVGPVVDSPGGAVVFRVVDLFPAHVPPLAEIHDRVDTALRTERATELAKAKAQALLPAVQQNGIDAVAKAEQRTVSETGPFARPGAYIPNIGNATDLKQAAFRLTPDKPVAPAVYSVAGSSVIAALKELVPAREEDFATQKAQLMRAAEDGDKRFAQDEFVNGLKARATIDINQDFLASVAGDMPATR